MKLFMMTTAVG